MKKNIKVCLLIIIVIVGIIIIIERDLIFKTSNVLFYLEDKYYNQEVSIEISNLELENKIKNKESFALFIHQPACSKSYEFNKIQSLYQQNNNISFNKILFEDLQKTKLSKEIKYFPSFAIFNNGELVDFLDAESNDDILKYKEYDEFSNWSNSYVGSNNEKEK
jgi:hypothetical protein